MKPLILSETVSISEQRLEELTIKLKADTITQEEKEEIAKSFIKLAVSMAMKRGNNDELISAALYGIAYAIRNAKEKMVDNNLGAWIAANIKRFIYLFLRTNFLVPIPYTTRKRNPSLVPMKRHPLRQIAVKDRFHIIEIKELLNKATRTEIERQIVHLRMQGYKDVEIAEQMSISTAYVNRIRHEIEGRFDKI